MVWIKRNLFFVLSAAVGVILMGVAGYFLYSGLSANSSSVEEYNGAVSEWQGYQGKTPFPSKDNIATAKQQQQEVKQFLGEVKSSFAPSPAPAKTDERGFKTILDKSIAQLQQAATNAGVGLPPQYAFSFSAITAKLNFPIQNIEPWTVQLQEIKSLCDVLFRAKVNFLEGIRRVPVGAEEAAGPDYLMGASSVTIGVCTRTPYELTFRAFSGEIATVIEELQKSKDFYIVKNVDIQPSTAATAYAQPGFTEPAPAPTAPPVYMGRGRGGQFQPGPAATFAAPVTVLSEKPLRVTLLVDVIKIKSP